jgi:VWFA-related protein
MPRLAATLVLVGAMLTLQAATGRATGSRSGPQTPVARSTPQIQFVSPVADAFVSGPTVLSARVLPDDTLPRQVVFYADGEVVCTLDAAPYECEWDAGRDVKEHRLRVVAVLASGERVSAALRTRKLGYAEAVDVDAVQVTTLVSDGQGHFIRGLKREQFKLHEDGVTRQITAFGAEELPLEAVVAVDISGSMGPVMKDVRQAVKHFLSSLRSGDAVTLLGFNNSVFTLARRESQPAARARAVDRLRPWGGTALYDAGMRALNMLAGQAGRKALIVFTDGDDNSSLASADALEQELRSSNAVLYAVALGRGKEVESLRQRLDRLATESGGRAIFAKDVSELDHAFADVVEELSNQYMLTYLPPRATPDGQWHRISVELAGLPYKVRAREGYLARRPTAPPR